MRKVLLRGVLPVLAAAAVLVLLILLACGIVQGELVLASRAPLFQKAATGVFFAFLFAMATGVAPGFMLKKFHVRNATAYLLFGAASGVLAEHCYLVENDVWDTWDFTAPQFAAILSQAISNLPSSLAGFVSTLPESAIPVAIGLIGSGLYWHFAVRRLSRRQAANGGASG